MARDIQRRFGSLNRLGWCFILGGIACAFGTTSSAQTEDEVLAAMQAIKAAGGSYHENKRLPGAPITSVSVAFKNRDVASRVLPLIGKLEQLQSLNLRGELPKSPPRQPLIAHGDWAFLAGLQTLTKLHLSQLELSAAAGKRIADLSALERLGLETVSVTDDAFESLKGCRGITSLAIRNDRERPGALTDKSLDTIASLSELKELELTNFPLITSRGFRALQNHPKLESVTFRDTSADDNAADSLATIRSLKSVATSEAELSDAGRRTLERVNVNVKLSRSSRHAAKPTLPVEAGAAGNAARLPGLEFDLRLPKGWAANQQEGRDGMELRIAPQNTSPKLDTRWILASNTGKSPKRAEAWAAAWGERMYGQDGKPLGKQVTVVKQTVGERRLTLTRAKGDSNSGFKREPDRYNLAAVIDDTRGSQWIFLFVGPREIVEANEGVFLELLAQFGFSEFDPK